MSLRPVKEILSTKPTLEGAGVHLQRAFGFGKTKEFDPFLLLDDFRNENPPTTWPDFPGIRTAASRPSLTYSPVQSSMATRLGNKGKMTAGDVQWMTAGSGILHQEMPKGDAAAACTAFSSGRICPPS